MTSATEKSKTTPDKLVQKKYVVAFLDFLGASEKMTSPEESDTFLQQIYKIYNEVCATIAFTNDYNAQKEGIKVKIFSDNLVVALECSDKSAKRFGLVECYRITVFCARIQAYALLYGLLMRGAITIGDLYIDDIFVFGEALVRAYKLESSVAKYPRIIISDDAFKIVSASQYKEEFGRWIVQDFDGIYLNFIAGHVVNVDQRISSQIIGAVRSKIIELVQSKEVASSIKIRKKYCWVTLRFNTLCKKSGFKEQTIKLGKFRQFAFVVLGGVLFKERKNNG